MENPNRRVVIPVWLRPAYRARRSIRAKVSGRLLAAVGDDVIGDLGVIRQAVETGLLDRRDMDEHVLAAAVRLNEAVTLLPIEPLYRPARHNVPPTIMTLVER